MKTEKPNKLLGDARVWRLWCTIKKYPTTVQKNTHCCVHDSCSMSSNRISNVSDIDGVQVLVITCSFNEDLGGRVGEKKKLFTPK